jgi:hypothetical protein
MASNTRSSSAGVSRRQPASDPSVGRHGLHLALAAATMPFVELGGRGLAEPPTGSCAVGGRIGWHKRPRGTAGVAARRVAAIVSAERFGLALWSVRLNGGRSQPSSWSIRVDASSSSNCRPRAGKSSGSGRCAPRRLVGEKRHAPISAGGGSIGPAVRRARAAGGDWLNDHRCCGAGRRVSARRSSASTTRNGRREENFKPVANENSVRHSEKAIQQTATTCSPAAVGDRQRHRLKRA